MRGTSSSSHSDREDAIAAFVCATLGIEPSRVARIEAFVTNEVFEVDAGGQRFVVKSSNRAALHAEVWAHARGVAAGCPAPAILGVADLGNHTSAVLMSHVTGGPIEAGHRALRELGKHLRRVHGVTLPGFGWLVESSRNAPGEPTLRHTSWLDFLNGICADTRRLADRHAIAASSADAASAAIDAHAEALTSIGVGSLCHGDLKATHVLVAGDRIAGVIDWGDAVVADPIWDVARFAHRADSRSISLLLEGYDPPNAMAETFAWRIPLYSGLWMLVDAVVDHRLGRRADAPLMGAMRYFREASSAADTSSQ